MNTCETLASLIEQARADNNEPLAIVLESAFAAAGCHATAESGGTGRPPPPVNNP